MYGRRILIWQGSLAFVTRHGRADCSAHTFKPIEKVCEASAEGNSGGLVSRRRLCTRTRWAAAIRGRGHFYINTAAGVVVDIVVAPDAWLPSHKAELLVAEEHSDDDACQGK